LVSKVILLAGLFFVAGPAYAAGNEFFNRVYLSETEALKLQMNAPGDRVVCDNVRLTDTEVDQVKKTQRVRMFTKSYRVWKFYKSGENRPYRYAIFLQEPGQHEYMDLMYGVNADGKIHRVDLLTYREPYGGEVAGRRFMKQYEGRSLRTNKFRVNRDVIHIVGATVSAHSVSNAARRALEILRLRGYTS